MNKDVYIRKLGVRPTLSQATWFESQFTITYIRTYVHKSFIKKMTERINLTIKDIEV